MPHMSIARSALLKEHTLQDGVVAYSISNVVANEAMPKRIILMLCEQDRFEGNITKTPYVFKQHGLIEVETEGDGGFDKMDLKEDKLMDSYQRFIRMRYLSGIGHAITFEQWKNNVCLHIFEFTPDDDFTDSVLYHLPRYKNFKLTFAVGSIPNKLKALFLLDFTAQLEMDMMKTIAFHEKV